MSEHLTGAHRLYFIGSIKITSPLHIGSGETVTRPDRPETDSPVQLDACGTPYLPATALGGLLRGTATNLATTLEGWTLNHVLSLFGAAREKERGQNQPNQNHPSRLRLCHAKLKGRWQGYTTFRDGVGIDRQRSSARKGALYNYEIVPAGAMFELTIELRDGSVEDQKLLALTLETLQQLPTAIGAKGNSGLGQLQLNIKKVVEVKLNEPDTLLTFLSQEQPFNPRCACGKSWADWRAEVLQTSVTLKSELEAKWRVPQAVTFSYHFTVEDPLLIRGQESPEGALDDYLERKKGLSLGTETKGIDATWIGTGVNPANRATWEPTVPGPSLRGIFRSHCERILRTLSWHYAADEAEYERKVAASDPLDQSGKEDPKNGSHLRSSGFALQKTVKDRWNVRSGGGADEQTLHEAGVEIANTIWNDSDLGERMWGSSQWKSCVSVSEACLPTEEDKKDWRELLFQHVAINRFTGGAAENKLFNALAVTRATFEGTITIFGDELWMLGLVALLFKDLHDGYIRIGANKTRGYGKVKGKLTRVEVKALRGTQVASTCESSESEDKIYQKWFWQLSSDTFQDEAPTCFKKLLDKAPAWFKKLLKKGVEELNAQVPKYTRFECRKKEEGE